MISVLGDKSGTVSISEEHSGQCRPDRAECAGKSICGYEDQRSGRLPEADA